MILYLKEYPEGMMTVPEIMPCLKRREKWPLRTPARCWRLCMDTSTYLRWESWTRCRNRPYSGTSGKQQLCGATV